MSLGGRAHHVPFRQINEFFLFLQVNDVWSYG